MLTASLQQQLKHDAPYAWFLRHQASRSPIFRKQHLAELDDRLEAYLDCYLISERAEQSLLPDLNFDDWGSVFVTAYEEDLPWPDPELVEQWWETNQSRFHTGTRYLAGLTLDNNHLATVRESGTQPQRHLANLMLAMREPSARLIHHYRSF